MEYDDEFKTTCARRTMAVDMETATLLTCGFANRIPTGFVVDNDQPMISSGVKTDESEN